MPWNDEAVAKLKAENWKSRCQEGAYEWLHLHPTHTLVHCRMNKPEGTILHAFCVHDDRVFDLTLKGIETWNKNEYFTKFQPYDLKEYNYDMALEWFAKSESFGFWEFPTINVPK